MISDGEEKMLDVSVSSDGSMAAGAKWDGTARVYDLVSQTEIFRFSGHKGPVNAVAFSSDDKTLFTASYDGDIRIWHLAEDGILSNYQNGSIVHSNGWGINVLAVIPDTGNLIYGSINGMIGVYDFNTDELRELGIFEKPILSLAVSEAANWFAAGSGDGFVRVYDLETFELIEEHRDAAGPVWGMAFSANGKRIYKAGLDDFVTHWHVSPRKAIEVSQSEYPRRFQVNDSADPGEIEFKRKCSVCHTLVPDDLNRAGPTLYGLFGRKAGTVEGYVYSEALKNSDIIWNEVTISRLFDEGPDIVTPGTKMPIQRLKSIERRNDLISYLKRATVISD
jgi:cytochrome c